MNPSAGDGFETGPGRRWSDRLLQIVEAAQSLVATRLAIFEEEAGAKARLVGKGLAFLSVAAAFAFGATLLLAALLAALLAQLFGNVALGILGAGVLYAAGAAAAGYVAWKALSEVKPTEFPATSRELARDADAIRAALAQDPDPEEGPSPDDDSPEDDVAGDSEGEIRDLEARLRAGME
jgi:uncharacterized membrane protein YqjE